LKDEQMMEIAGFLNRRGIEVEGDELIAEREWMDRYVKISLARFLYGREAFYQARAAYDDDVAAALHEIEVGTVKELGLR
jgi:hypothetical protein